jgi:hypothetical protein
MVMGILAGTLMNRESVVEGWVVASIVSCQDRVFFLPFCHDGGGEDGDHGDHGWGANVVDVNGVGGGDLDVGADGDGDGGLTCPRRYCSAL